MEAWLLSLPSWQAATVLAAASLSGAWLDAGTTGVSLEAGALTLGVGAWALALARLGDRVIELVDEDSGVAGFAPVFENLRTFAVLVGGLFAVLPVWRVDVTPLLASARHPPAQPRRLPAVPGGGRRDTVPAARRHDAGGRSEPTLQTDAATDPVADARVEGADRESTAGGARSAGNDRREWPSTGVGWGGPWCGPHVWKQQLTSSLSDSFSLDCLAGSR